MTRHGPTRPRAEAIALRATARAAREADDTDPVADFGDISGGGSHHTKIKTINPVRAKSRYAAVAFLLSGDPTSKSP